MTSKLMMSYDWAVLRQLFAAGAVGVWPGDLLVHATALLHYDYAERFGPGDARWRITEGGVGALFGSRAVDTREAVDGE